jgi:hypothetical protein
VDAIVTAANAVLSAWEEGSEKTPSPRVRSVNLADGSVTMDPTTGEGLAQTLEGRDDV